MRKQLGGLVSSLAFVLACEDATGPQQAATSKVDPGIDGSCPQLVEFDSETGQMTILDSRLSNQLRAFYGVQSGAAGQGTAVIVFVGSQAKSGAGDDAIRGADTVVNYRC